MSNQSIIYNFLTTKAGLTPEQAYGVMGNLQVESDLNPDAYNGNEGGIGIVQWEGGRRTALQSFAAARGTDETDLETQLEFMLHEWRTTESSAYQQIRSAGTAQQAAALDDEYYERSSGSSRQQREEDAVALAGGEMAPDSAGETLLTPHAKPPTKQEYEDALGSLSAVLTAVPDLNKLLNKAIALHWTPQQFQNQVEQSNWYQNHSAAARQIIALQYSDPAEYKSQLSQAYQTVRQQAHAMGVELSKEQIHALGMDYITKSWSSQTLANQVGAHYNGNGPDSGTAAQYKTQLEQLYTEYGLPWTDAHMQQKLQKLLSGKVTMDAYQRLAEQEAQSLYPSIAAQLTGGMTVQDVASPYISTMSQLLEVDPNTLSIQTPLIKKALQGQVTVQNGKSTASSTPLWQFEQQVRNDPRWDQTDNAKQSAASLVMQIGKAWGFEQ